MKKIPAALLGLIFFTISCILFLSLISYKPTDLSNLAYPQSSEFNNLIGIVGAYIGFGLTFMFGRGSFFIPVYFFLLGTGLLGIVRFYGFAKGKFIKILAFVFLFSFICAFIGIFFSTKNEVFFHSGLIGFFLSGFFTKYLGFWGSFLLLGSMIVVLSWLLSGFFFADIIKLAFSGATKCYAFTKEIIQSHNEEKPTPTLKPKVNQRQVKKPKEVEQRFPDTKPEIKMYTPKISSGNLKKERPIAKEASQPLPKEEKDANITPFDAKAYKLPELDLIKVPPFVDNESTKEDIEASIKAIEEALASFGVGAKVISVQKGPVVTMYELLPSSGVKIQRITTLADDLALAMKSSNVRVVAPIPGKGTIGVEIPNDKKLFVYLREVIEEKKFATNVSKLTFAIGKDVKGDPIIADLKSMPHLLIAGTTGSGKTVCMNAIISSILFKSKPDEVKFIMVDPKKVELAPFGGIPHLIHPIISDAKKACAALNWATVEMEGRYKLLAAEGTRNIDAYNKKGMRMPYIVIVVDELADLMIVARDKIETTIQRLAQLSRAVGIHLILATQRPSVDVITGVIKANFPARIAFKVASGVDSRTVLDSMGAEKLLGQGDLLFIEPGLVTPIRAQACFIDDEDIESLNNFIRAQGGPVYEEGIAAVQKRNESRIASDELMEEAIKVILMTNQASATLLQRRLRVGYTRAARLLDLIEEEGIIGPFCGSKAREILVDPNEYMQEKGLV